MKNIILHCNKAARQAAIKIELDEAFKRDGGDRFTNMKGEPRKEERAAE